MEKQAIANESLNAIAAAVNTNIRNAAAVQNEIAYLFANRARSVRAEGNNDKEVSAQSSRKGKKFEETLRLAFDDHPYLIDHSIVRQPKDWAVRDDINPIVPFSMSLELFAEIAMKHAPGKKLIKIGNAAAYRWIGLAEPLDIKVKGEWISENVLSISLGEYASAECTFGDEWPKPPAEFERDLDIGGEIVKQRPTSEWYERFSFHGPQYHSAIEHRKICERGMLSVVKAAAGKGSLLDVLGQQLGLFLHITQEKDPISFPVSLKELNLYADIFDQKGVFENTILLNKLTGAVAAMDSALKRDGAIWAVARGYTVQRFFSTPAVWKVILNPQFNKLAEEAAPGVYFYSSGLQDNVIALLAKRYLSASDKKTYEQLKTSKQRREHVISRIALKDAVRMRLAEPDGEMLYPVEFSCIHDEQGKPLLQGLGLAENKVDSLEVSLSHKGYAAIAIVSEAPVGIDLEKIEEKSEEFINASFTEREINLLKNMNTADAVTRFWAAKEAYAKMNGTGLKGDPKRYEVSAVEGGILYIEGSRVKTLRLADDFVAGWTI